MLKIQLTEHDVLAAYVAHLPGYRFAAPAAWLCGLLSVAAFLLPGNLDSVAAVALAFCGLVLAVMRFVLLPRKAKRVFARHPEYHRAQFLSWNENGLAVASKTGSNVTYWEDFARWRTGGGVILLYLSDTRFHIVPEVAFSSLRALKDFKLLLWEKIGEPPLVILPHAPPIERP